LVAVQLFVGAIHLLFGLWLLSTPRIVPFFGQEPSPDLYSIYTLVFGLLTLVFTGGIWLEKSWGWICTSALSMFVITADSLTLLDLPSIPGIPKSAALPEIVYSLLIILYLFQAQIKTKYRLSRWSG
jgi:uncharacterized membrane protein (DUF2068 family)